MHTVVKYSRKVEIEKAEVALPAPDDAVVIAVGNDATKIKAPAADVSVCD